MKGQLSGQLELKAPLVGGGGVRGGEASWLILGGFHQRKWHFTPPLCPIPQIPGAPPGPGKQDQLSVGEGGLRGGSETMWGPGGGKAGHYPDSKPPAPSYSPILEYCSGFC